MIMVFTLIILRLTEDLKTSANYVDFKSLSLVVVQLKNKD